MENTAAFTDSPIMGGVLYGAAIITDRMEMVCRVAHNPPPQKNDLIFMLYRALQLLIVDAYS